MHSSWGWLNRTHPPMSRDWTRPISSLLWRALPSTRAYRSARSIVKASTKITAVDIAYAREMGYVLKLLAIAKRSGSTIEVRVHPTLIANDHPLSQVNGSFNAVYLHGHACKEMMLQGRGAAICRRRARWWATFSMPRRWMCMCIRRL